jgi:hypothetical protein
LFAPQILAVREITPAGELGKVTMGWQKRIRIIG